MVRHWNGGFRGGEWDRGPTCYCSGCHKVNGTAALYSLRYGHKKKVPGRSCDLSGTLRTAAAYSSDWYVSTIGDGGLNFSVRNGKRWCPAAIAAAVYNLREMTWDRTRKPQVRRTRSEERRVGKECRSRWSPYH